MTAIHVLLLVALFEVAINRLIVPMTEPVGDAPINHLMVKNLGLFCFYFTGALAVLVIMARSISVLVPSMNGVERDDRRVDVREKIAYAALGLAALVACVPLVITIPDWAFVVEIAFIVTLFAILASTFGREHDLGVQIGLPIMCMPLVFHSVTFAVWKWKYPDVELADFNMQGAPGEKYALVSVITMSLAALATPYCFSPRPFARAVTRPVPIVVAMSLAAIGAIAARIVYPELAKAVQLAIHVKLDPLTPDPKLALYLLAFATLAWTLTACALSRNEGRRAIGLGLGLIVLGGYQFQYAHHFLLPLLGVALIAEAASRVRQQELEALPLVAEAPPISDGNWSMFVGTVANGLKRSLVDVHSVTTRGEAGLSSSVIVGTASGLTVRTRIERIEGSVVALDVVVGREIDELRGSTVTVWAMPLRGMGTNPPGPPAAPVFKTGDAAFDDKFRARGNTLVFNALFDDGTRARATATLDGWLAYWDREGLRYRVYPGRGAPLDHPLPLSDLALGRIPGNAERLLTVVELLVDLGTRVLARPAEPEDAPQELAP